MPRVVCWSCYAKFLVKIEQRIGERLNLNERVYLQVIAEDLERLAKSHPKGEESEQQKSVG